VPAVLQVITLDMGLLVAGTKYRGEFEERLKKLMDEIKQNDDIILVSMQCSSKLQLVQQLSVPAD
jgi:ATP-dependent Clp protease ATP-binding subunit ClpA